MEFVSPPDFVQDQTINDLVVAGIIGFIIFIIGELSILGFKLIKVLTCGLACLLYPIFSLCIGFIELIGTQTILPNWFDFDHTIWKVILISFAIGFFRIPTARMQKLMKGKKKTKKRERH